MLGQSGCLVLTRVHITGVTGISQFQLTAYARNVQDDVLCVLHLCG